MSSGVIARSSVVIDSVDKLGAVDLGDLAMYVANGTSVTQSFIGNGMRDDSQITAFSYEVPFNRQAVLQSLQVVCDVGSIWEDSNVSGDYTRRSGQAYVSIAGSQVSEEGCWIKTRVQSGGSSSQVGDTSGGGGPWSVPKQLERRPSFGDGIQLVSGEVFSITYDPQTAGSGVGIFPHIVHATLHAVDTVTGVPILRKGKLFPADATSGQTVLSYTTGPNGITILNWAVWAEGGPPIMFDAPEIHHNGVIMAELPLTAWTIDRSKGMNVIFPFWGVKIGAYEKITVRVRPWATLGQVITTTLYGKEIATGFPRGRAR